MEQQKAAVTYNVAGINTPNQEFSNPQEAVTQFVDIPAHDRPHIIRTVDGGAQAIGQTSMTTTPGKETTYGKWVGDSDPELKTAYEKELSTRKAKEMSQVANVLNRDSDVLDTPIHDYDAHSASAPRRSVKEVASVIDNRREAIQIEAANTGTAISSEAAKQWAAQDVSDFREMAKGGYRKAAANTIAENSENEDYRNEFNRTYPKAVKEIEKATVRNEERRSEKDAKDLAFAENIGIRQPSVDVDKRQDLGKSTEYLNVRAQLEEDLANKKDVQKITVPMISEWAADGLITATEQKKLMLDAMGNGKDIDSKKDVSQVEEIDPRALAQVAAARARDMASARQTLGGNAVESDEIFTAHDANKPIIPPDVEKRYVRDGNKYYEPENRKDPAFVDKGNKLETRSNGEQVAESLVRIAEARGWDEIKVSGSETFRKEAWLEAAARGMHVKGYSPSEQDKAALASRTASRTITVAHGEEKFRASENEPSHEAKSKTDRRVVAFEKATPAVAVKEFPELAGAYAALNAAKHQAAADGYTPKQQEVIASQVRQRMMNSIEKGRIPEIVIKEEVAERGSARETRREAEAERAR